MYSTLPLTDLDPGQRLRWKGTPFPGTWAPDALPMRGDETWGPGAFDPIAARTVDMLDEHGKPLQVFRSAWHRRTPPNLPLRDFPRERTLATLEIGRPMQTPLGVWTCPYRVRALDTEQTFWSLGFDSVHALRGAVQGAGRTIDTTEELIAYSTSEVELADIGLPTTRDVPEDIE
jgi:uncharacterized protein DUF6968